MSSYSYQIKSTPFFRRLVSTSKKNGQLKKLKDEYERIKEFNDRTIEMKMRQVRLKRLFREIEEIKETTNRQTIRRRRQPSDFQLSKTNEEIRMETLVKAKELGKEYSKLNALMVQRSAVKSDVTGMTPKSKYKSNAERNLTHKRISYGNEMSRSNIERLNAQCPKKLNKPITQSNMSIEMEKERLKQRLNYGNSCSHVNMVRIPKRLARQQQLMSIAKLQLQQKEAMKRNDDEADNEQILYERLCDYRKARRYNEMNGDKILEALQLQRIRHPNMYNKRLSRQKSQRAKRRWKQLSGIISNQLDLQRRENVRLSFDDDSQPKPIIISSELDYQYDGFDQDSKSEILLKIQRFNDCSEGRLKDNWNDKPVPNQDEVYEDTQDDKSIQAVRFPKTPEITHQRVQEYVKRFEPIAHEVAKKEAYEFGVHKLKKMFEKPDS